MAVGNLMRKREVRLRRELPMNACIHFGAEGKIVSSLASVANERMTYDWDEGRCRAHQGPLGLAPPWRNQYRLHAGSRKQHET